MLILAWMAALAIDTSASRGIAAPSDERPPEDVRIGGDEKKRYLLHSPAATKKEPASGWRVLVVLPGGGGGADFAPFVGNIRDNSLGDEWLIAELVAPVWDEEQAKNLVWPTEKHP